MSIQRVVFATVIVGGLVLSSICFGYSGGTGEPNDPYQISNATDWQTLMSTSSDWNRQFLLTADIDLAGVTLTPVGSFSTSFTGTLNGNNHIISHVTINMPTGSRVGLFGVNDGQIYDLGLESVNVTGNSYVGALCGFNYETISHCYAKGIVYGSSNAGWVGGLVGWNNGLVACCYSEDFVIPSSPAYYIGGLIGYNNGQVSYCYSAAPLLIGSGSFSNIGGLIGLNRYYVTGCFYDANVSGQTVSGGGKWLSTSQMKSPMPYQNAGWADKGWVIDPNVDYPRLAWQNTSGSPIGPSQTVPLSGSGSEADPYQIWTPADFALLNWYVSILDKHIVLMADLNMAGTRLEPIGEGNSPFSGTFDGNYHVISNAVITRATDAYVGIFGQSSSAGRIFNLGLESMLLTGNITFGSLVGRNFGVVTNCCTSGSVAGNFSGGGLVGENNGSLSYCYATNTISTSQFAGGLAARNSGSIEQCYATGNVSSSSSPCYAGGLVGYNASGTVTSCYATGTINGNGSDVGGLIGINSKGKIIRSYSIGKPMGNSNVGGLCGSKTTGGNYEDAGNFWDTQTSQTTTSAMGTGKTTIEMKTLSTFTSAGWDFTNETSNGDNNIWRMCVDEVDYPRLNWELTGGDFACPMGVNIEDLDYIVQRWLLTNCSLSNNYCGGADVDGSGEVDFWDFAVFANNWLEGD
jgi:hypothetical protein